MKINDFFKQEYLVAGSTYDNFIFENCPNEFLNLAKKLLGKSNNNVVSCVVCIDRQIEEDIEKTLNNFSENIQKKILARDFITALVVKELLKHKYQDDTDKNFVNEQLRAFLKNDFIAVKKMHADSFMPYDIKRIAKSVGKIELDFILHDVQNQYLQQATNIFISSREPYSVKIFTNNKRLSTYYDIDGNIIESPHDFMIRDVNKFIKYDNTISKEQ